MSEARFLSPRRRWLPRVLPMLGLALTGWGCQQPPYYTYYGTGSPGCMPVVPAPTATVNSRPGGPPTQVIDGGMTSSGSRNGTTTVIGSEAPQRVVVSQTDDSTRPAWRPSPNPVSDSDPVVTTSVEGAVSSSGSSTNSSSPPSNQ
jgi:hypothetical protein